MQTTITVESIPRIINESRGYSIIYKGDHYSVSERLQEYGKTPLELLNGILKTKEESFNLERYKTDLDNLFCWINFFIDLCRRNPDLQRTCDEYMGWIKENSSIIEKMKKDAKDWTQRNYNQKTLANKFEKTRNQFFPQIQQLRGIFYQFEKGLYEGSNIQFQEPDNPVSD